jgi:hypothetical protein
MIILIFGGTFIVHYLRKNEILIELMIELFVGIIFLIYLIFWRLREKKMS